MRTKGITMVETVFYIALFSVISVFVFDLLRDTAESFARLKQARAINETSVFVMERLARDIRAGTNIDFTESTFASNPGRLTVNTINASGTPVVAEYSVIGGAVYLRENGVLRGALMSSSTRVEGLVFNFMQVGQVQGVRIDLHLLPAGVSAVDAEHFYNTALLRGSY